jgi:hypothetical protein
MKRSLALVLFYATAALVVADLYAVASRFTGSQPTTDPVNWLRVAFAVLLQLLAVGGTVLYFAFLSRYDKPNTKSSTILDALRLRFVPVLAAALLAAFSFNMLYNAMNCGNHPFPVNRSPACPV